MNVSEDIEERAKKDFSWIHLLPEIYDDGEDGFLARFLGVFQFFYEKMTERIDFFPHLLYPEYADRQMLEWMASWMEIEDVWLWNDAQLASLLINQRRLLGMRGTKAYLEEMVELYTGFCPYIVEHYQLIPYKTNMEKTAVLEKLYGSSAYVVTVILTENAVKEQKDIEALQRIVDNSMPAGVECRLVVLKPCIYLSHYSYLGLNSRLAAYEAPRLNEQELHRGLLFQ